MCPLFVRAGAAATAASIYHLNNRSARMIIPRGVLTLDAARSSGEPPQWGRRLCCVALKHPYCSATKRRFVFDTHISSVGKHER